MFIKCKCFFLGCSSRDNSNSLMVKENWFWMSIHMCPMWIHEVLVNHILLGFPFTQKCWSSLYGKHGWIIVLTNDILNLFKSWPMMNKTCLYRGMLIIIPSIILWQLWKERNQRIFQRKKLAWESFINKVEVDIVEVMNSRIES